MEFRDVISKRQSVRVFTPEPIVDDVLESILNVVRQAPTAGNLQAYQVYVVGRGDLTARLAHAALGQEFVAQAAAVLVFCADPEQSAQRYLDRGRTLYSVQDATIACTFAMLAATDLGLASVWVGAYDDDAVRKALDLPQHLRPVALLPIGHPDEDPDRRPRRAVAELAHRL